jgi:TP901 family phage tail tape measure protein
LAEDIELSIGLDDSSLIKDLRAAKKILESWVREIQSGSGVIEARLKVNTEQATAQVNDALKSVTNKINNPAIIATGRVSSDKRQTDAAQKQEVELAAIKQKTADVQAKRNADMEASVRRAIALEKKREDAALRGIEKISKAEYDAQVKIQAAKENERVKGLQGRNLFQTQAADKARQSELAALRSDIKARAELEDKAAKDLQSKISNLPRLRYALYDVASATQGASQNLLVFAETAVTAAAQYETAFTNVERTTGATGVGLQLLNDQLINLSTQIPLSFQEISGIASLGAQLGVASTDLAGFTKNVTQFAAVTNVSAESAAQSFGALGELLGLQADQYANLGSSIAFAGVQSVATESEILAVATAIGGVAASADLTAQDVVALSTSLASLRVPAEQSRGALTRVFSEINRASANGGDQLNTFAQVLGTSAEQAKALADTDLNKFFNDFVAGLSGMSSGQLTQTLDALSLSDIRVTNTLARLAGNLDLVNKNQQIVNQSFAEGTFLTEAYGTRVDDIASRFQILLNNLNNLAASAGKALAPILGPIIDFLSRIANGLNIILSSSGGQIFAGIAVSIAAFGAALFGLVTAVALSSAGIFAFKTAFDGLQGSSILADNALVRLTARILGIDVAAKTAAAGTGKLATGMTAVAGATNVATASTNGFKVALISTGIGAVVLLLGTLAASFMAAGSSANIANGIFADTSGLAEALATDTQARNDALAAGNYAVLDSYTALTPATQENTGSVTENYQALRNAADVLDIAPPAYNALNDAIDENTQYLGANTTAWVANKLMQNETFQELASNPNFKKYLDTIKFNLGDFLQAQAANGEQGVIDYFKKQEAAARANGAQFVSAITQVYVQAGNASKVGAEFFSNSVGTLGFNVTQLSGLTGGLVNTAALGAGAFRDLGNGANDAANDITKAGNAAGGAAPKIRTLVDYANDLSSVFSRAFDIRFSGQSTLDAVTSSFADIAEKTEKANQKIQDLRADLDSLTADKALQEYFLSVAIAYGDTLAAAKIQAKINKINSQLTSTNENLSDAQSDANKTLVGNSAAAIENRKTITNLVQTYQSHIQALAASGASQEELAAETARLKQDFIAQATQLGFNRNELGTYAAAFDDVTVAIDNVPRDITVSANTNPALQALNEFIAKAKSAVGGGIRVPVIAVEDPPSAIIAGQIQGYLAMRASIQAQIANAGSSQAVGSMYRSLSRINGFLAGYGYAEGGYVSGPGGPTSDSINARLSNGEYVIRAAAVNRYGAGFFDQLNQMQTPKFASGGLVSTPQMGGMVSLSPEDRALLRNVGGSGQVVLYANNEAIARSANDGNRSIVAAGGRP